MTTFSVQINNAKQLSVLSALAESWNVAFTVTNTPCEFTPLLQQSIDDVETGKTLSCKDSDDLMKRIYAEVQD